MKTPSTTAGTSATMRILTIRAERMRFMMP
jgi:hypothetical protein